MSTAGISRRSALKVLTVAAAGSLWARPEPQAWAASPRVLADGQLPDDVRLGALKDLNGYFPWSPSATAAEWEQRAEFVRRQILVACGLWPMPARPAIQATVHGKVERDGYTVEKVFFESHAGLYVTGSLYRPASPAQEKRPAVLCPHGHWADGRFFGHNDAQIAEQIQQGAEKFDVGGRHPMQARCVHLARMGCVVFLYDMLGYADNQTLSFELTHQFAKQRPELSQPDHWGLFSAQSELRLLNVLGMQTWNSIRALDWLETLPDVDPQRIGVTGASGGGTQTFILGAVDPRPVAFFPAVMVSTAMQGGCTCENASLLRIGTGNIEFAALLAPRVLGMSAANDWTRELETKGLPQLRQHYDLLGVPDRVSGKHLPFAHNYNHPSRAMMYAVFQQAFGLKDASLEEQDYVPLTREEATVWSDEYPRPQGGDAGEQTVLQGFAREFDQQLAELTPRDAGSLERYQQIIGGGWQAIIGRDLRSTGNVMTEHRAETARNGYREIAGVVRNVTHHEELPFIALIPDNWNNQLVFWLTDSGKQGLFAAAGTPVAEVRQLMDAGYGVAGADLLYQGEFLQDAAEVTETRRVNNPREFLGYTVGYNHPLFAQRTHDVLTLIAAARALETPLSAMHIVAQGGTSLYAAAAAIQSGVDLQKLVLATGGYRFRTITDIRDPLLLPGALRYGDVPGLLALRAPQPTYLVGEDADQLALATAAFQAVDSRQKLSVGPSLAAGITWLLT